MGKRSHTVASSDSYALYRLTKLTLAAEGIRRNSPDIYSKDKGICLGNARSSLFVLVYLARKTPRMFENQLEASMNRQGKEMELFPQRESSTDRK